MTVEKNKEYQTKLWITFFSLQCPEAQYLEYFYVVNFFASKIFIFVEFVYM